MNNIENSESNEYMEYGGPNGVEGFGSSRSLVEDCNFIRPKKSREKFEVSFCKERSKSQNDTGRLDLGRTGYLKENISFEEDLDRIEESEEERKFGIEKEIIERPIKPMVKENLDYYKNSEKKIKKKNIFYQKEDEEGTVNHESLFVFENPDFEKKSFLSFKKKSFSRQNSVKKKFVFNKKKIEKKKSLKIPKIMKTHSESYGSINKSENKQGLIKSKFYNNSNNIKKRPLFDIKKKMQPKKSLKSKKKIENQKNKKNIPPKNRKSIKTEISHKSKPSEKKENSEIIRKSLFNSKIKKNLLPHNFKKDLFSQIKLLNKKLKKLEKTQKHIIAKDRSKRIITTTKRLKVFKKTKNKKFLKKFTQEFIGSKKCKEYELNTENMKSELNKILSYVPEKKNPILNYSSIDTRKGFNKKSRRAGECAFCFKSFGGKVALREHVKYCLKKGKKGNKF